jgi:hypothetical protein
MVWGREQISDTPSSIPRGVPLVLAHEWAASLHARAADEVTDCSGRRGRSEPWSFIQLDRRRWTAYEQDTPSMCEELGSTSWSCASGSAPVTVRNILGDRE